MFNNKHCNWILLHSFVGNRSIWGKISIECLFFFSPLCFLGLLAISIIFNDIFSRTLFHILNWWTKWTNHSNRYISRTYYICNLSHHLDQLKAIKMCTAKVLMQSKYTTVYPVPYAEHQYPLTKCPPLFSHHTESCIAQQILWQFENRPVDNLLPPRTN